MHDTPTLVAALREHAERRPQDVFCYFEAGAATEEISFAVLVSGAGFYADRYRALGFGAEDVVFVILRHSPDLLYAFLGALIAGCIPAFLAPISPKQSPEVYWSRLAGLLRNVGAAAAIVEPEDREAIAGLAPAATQILTPTAGRLRPEQVRWADPRPDDVAFLQFSSGTTGQRKGVMLSHRSVLAQVALYRPALDIGPEDRIASWLPLYHDMGLIACFIVPLVTATPIVLMDAFEWVARPVRLFEAITRHRATLVWLPNFAFNHLAASVPARPGLDLSSVRGFINCSEPCKIESMRRFAAKFAAIGAREDQLQACYAMAEAVFAVTQSRLGKPPVTLAVDRAAFAAQRIAPAAGEASQNALELVSTGALLPGFEVRILGPDKQELPADRVGEIAIRGPSMFTGYYRSPEAEAQPFHEGWYLTGDLGFVHEGEVFVTGRSKDIIIVYGKNFYAHDIEEVVSGVAGVKSGRAVAFGVFSEAAGSESAVIVAETTETDAQARRQITLAVKAALVDALDLAAGAVLLVDPNWLLKTTSGKISRAQNREKYLATRHGRGEER
jgi:acyl-CoA synthetase (AMP-forming)/AMP-acid ligase II